MLNGLDLFSGIGGISIALSEWVRPIAYCEIDPYCQGVLLSKMSIQQLHRSPIWDDIRTFDGQSLHDHVDFIYGGFPCQDISIAGNGKGLAGERSGLFFEIVRLAKEIKPKFIFLENVPAITSRGGLQVVRAIAEMGYDCRWCVISAASVGALHKRERWFLLAHSNKKCEPRLFQRKEKENSGIRIGRFNGNANCITGEQAHSKPKSEQTSERAWRRPTGQCWPFESREHWQETVSTVCRISDGLPFHVDRLRSLGNAVVPCQAKEAFKILMGLKK
jgi:DNA (cytosine-5)-methyltransferase 1